MKPHKETLRARTVGAIGSIVVRDVNGNEHIVASVDSDGHARFFAAAPDMARALLGVGHVVDGVWHTGACEEYTGGVMEHCHDSCGAARAALRKAGVLP